MANLKELHEQRNKLIADLRKLVDEAGEDGLTAEQRSQYDKMWEDQKKLLERMQDEKRVADAEAEQAALLESRGVKSAHELVTSSNGEPATDEPFEWEYRGEKILIEPDAPEYARCGDAYQAAFRNYLMPGDVARRAGVEAEFRALQADADAAGGYWAPQQFVADLIKKMDDLLWIRRLGTVYPLSTGDSVGFPSLENDPADDTWTSELSAGSADSTMTAGARTLTPHPLAKYILVSNKLLRVSAIPADALVRDRLAYKLAVTEEKGFLTGTGAQQPLGLFVASAQGINTTADVSTGNTTTAIGADNITECFYTLKPQYRTTASWVMHTDSVKAISKLKTGDGEPLWGGGLRAGDPDVIKGRPVYESRYAPNTFTTGLYVGLFGDLSFYWIAESMGHSVRRLDELGALTDQAYFLDRTEVDGMPVLEEPFARMTLA